MVEPIQITTVNQLSDEFDLFLFDQYGVLHNGRETYAGMADCISALKSIGKYVGVISNSGKRAAYNASRLQSFGFGPDLIDQVFSSGEVAWSELQGSLEVSADNKRTVFYIGGGEDRSAIQGLPLQETDDIDSADLLLICGCEPHHYSLEYYTALVHDAARRGVHLYCTNPDRWSLVGQTLTFGPGQIAAYYETLGGKVTWIGKPYAAIYQFALSSFDCRAERTLCIGDSVEHDIAGAARVGCASLLSATGILADLSDAELVELYERYDATPDYMIERT